MKKVFALALGLVLLGGCASEVAVYGPPPPVVYVDPAPVIVYGPYYGPYWHGYYWHPQYHYYYHPGPHYAPHYAPHGAPPPRSGPPHR
jgi:hypothetical protein